MIKVRRHQSLLF